MVCETTKMYCLHFSKDVAAERCGDGVLVQNVLECFPFYAVSYTHLTLPTILLV